MSLIKYRETLITPMIKIEFPKIELTADSAIRLIIGRLVRKLKVQGLDQAKLYLTLI